MYKVCDKLTVAHVTCFAVIWSFTKESILGTRKQDGRELKEWVYIRVGVVTHTYYFCTPVEKNFYVVPTHKATVLHPILFHYNRVNMAVCKNQTYLHIKLENVIDYNLCTTNSIIF